MTPVSLLVAALLAAPVAAPPRVIQIAAHDFSYTMPDSLPAGVYTFEMTNDGREEHHAVFLRLEQGKRLADLLAAMRPDAPFPSWAVFIGGPEGPTPGRTARATMPLAPGRYAVLCFIPSADGAPHFAKGMTKEFTVTGKRLEGSLPRADAELVLKDYDFAFSKPLRAGRQTVEVRVLNGQPHEIAVHKLAPGKTLTDYLHWLQKPEGPEPARLWGGIAPIAAGESAQFTLDLEPGEYALLCHIPDQKDGKPHIMHGMARALTIR
jgi:uncharacterized cupredoxin-like copper-binding protein